MAATEKVSSYAQKKLFIKIPAKIWNEQASFPYCLSPIRIPTFFWNAQTSPATSWNHPITEKFTTAPNSPHNKAEQSQPAVRVARAPTLRKLSKLAHSRSSTILPPAKKEETAWPVTRCKTPLYRFNHNYARDEIRLETPCLQRTCKSCVKWHPQLIQELIWPVSRPVVEPLSPIIDPRLLKPWAGVVDEERRVSDVAVLELPDPVLQPIHACVKQNMDEYFQPPPQLSISQMHDLFLPSKLLDRTISRPIFVKSLWRTSPRQRYTAILPFRTQTSRYKFADRVARTRIMEGRERVRGILKARRGIVMGKRGRDAVIGARGFMDEGTRAKKVRFRHRVRLVFKSVEGKRRFGEVVGTEVGGQNAMSIAFASETF